MGSNCLRGDVKDGVGCEKGGGGWTALPMVFMEPFCVKQGAGKGTSVMGAIWPAKAGPPDA